MNIYESIAAVQEQVDFIGKEKTVQSGGGYCYRGVDQVLNTLHPLFAKNKVFAVPEVMEILVREWRKTSKGGDMIYQVLRVKYTFYAEDGTSISAIVFGEAMDSGDKVSNKCMSVAYKYACFQILSIPTEETTADPDDQNERWSSEAKKSAGPLTRAEIASYGVRDVDGMIKWLESKGGKRIGEFTEEDTEISRNTLRQLQEKRKKEEAARQQADRSEDIPF